MGFWRNLGKRAYCDRLSVLQVFGCCLHALVPGLEQVLVDSLVSHRLEGFPVEGALPSPGWPTEQDHVFIVSSLKCHHGVARLSIVAEGMLGQVEFTSETPSFVSEKEFLRRPVLDPHVVSKVPV